MSLARQLAQRITAMRYEDLPPEAVHWCKVAVLDTVGVALAGSVEQAPRMVEEVMGLRPDNGPCLIIGTHRRAAPLDAALVNGTSAHALDFDNTAKSLGGHASAVIVPALLAAGEDCGASGRDLDQALQLLSGEQRRVVLLVGLEGLSYAETAEILEIPVGTVMSRLARGRDRLRTLMDYDGDKSGRATLRRVK